MSLKKLLCLAVLLGSIGRAGPPDPDPYGIVFRLSGAKLEPLEARRAQFETLHLLAPIQRDYLSIPGEHSQVRYAAGQPLSFAVRYRLPLQNNPAWANPTLDPNGFCLYPLRPDGQRRLLVLAESTQIRTTVHSGMAFQVTTLGQDSLKLQPGEPLEPGEYAVLYGRNVSSCNVYCFGIDASPSPSSP